MAKSRSRTASLPVVPSREEARVQAWLDIVRLFGRLSRQITTAISRRGGGMTLPQFDVLATLRLADDITQNDLAERLLVSKGNVCQVLDRLEKLKWVERRTDEKDGRAKRIRLTTTGRRKIEAVLPEHNDLVLRSGRKLADADVKSLRKALRSWETGLETRD